MSWFGEGRRRAVSRRGALVMVMAALAAACIAAVATLVGLGPSAGSVRATGTGAPVGVANVADTLSSPTAFDAGTAARRPARRIVRTGRAASVPAAGGKAVSRRGRPADTPSGTVRRAAYRPSVRVAGSSHGSISSTGALDGLPLGSAADSAAVMRTDAITNATKDSRGATTAAVDPLVCTTGTIYDTGSGTVDGGTGPQGLFSVATTAIGGSSVPATTVATTTGTSAINALGVTAGGTAAYWVNKTNGDIYEYNAAANTVTDVGASGVTGANVNFLNAGAVNVANGFFYYAYASATGTMVLYAFNTNTNTLVGQVATASAPFFSNGDIAFDAGGNLYWVGSAGTTAALGVIPGPIPTTASTTATLTGKTITTYADPTSAQYDGIAFDNTGNLYLQTLNTSTSPSTTSLEQVDPLAGTVKAGPTPISPAIAGTDLGACATNPSLSLQKHVVGRIQPSDQFTLAITGPGISGSTTGATATTSGTSTGIQSQLAGPLPVISGNTYTLTETATNSNLSSYTTTYSCTNAGTTVASGTGTSFTFTMPTPGTGQLGPSIVCVFTNTPLTSSLSIAKSASPTSVATVGQTVTYTYTVTNTGQTPLTAVHVSDTQQAPAGGLTSGPACQSLTSPAGTCSGSSTSLAVGQVATFTATYTVTQADLNNGSINDSATATGTPPSGPATTSPPATVTVTTANIARLTLTKVVDMHHVVVGGLLHYRILVVNHGPDAANDVVVHDTPSIPMTVISVHTSVGHCSVTHGDDITCDLGTLANGEQVTINVAAYALVVGNELNTASATTTSHNPNPSGATAHATTKVVSPLSLTKTAKPTTIETGQSVTFTMAVKNLSSRTLNNVRVCDMLPAGLLYVSSNPRSALVGESRCWTIKHLPGHATRSVKLVVNAAPGNSNRLVNVATVHVHGLPTLRARRTIWVSRRPTEPCPDAVYQRSTARTQPTAHAAC